jgi:A/G-specific adenine glycosylase
VDVLVVRDPGGRVPLERRPAGGIWGHSPALPELAADDAAAAWCERQLGARVSSARALLTIEHAFTHFDLDLRPLVLELAAAPACVADRGDRVRHDPRADLPVGVPAPVAITAVARPCDGRSTVSSLFTNGSQFGAAACR